MDYKNILLIKMSSLGDILHTLPFAAALRQRFPQARITSLPFHNGPDTTSLAA